MRTWHCLRCDARLRLRSVVGKKIDPIICKECGAGYAYDALGDADPQMWEKIRHNKNFTESLTEPGILRIEGGLGLNPEKESLK